MTESKHHHITEKIIGAAYNVHNTLGSGLEKVYQNSLAIELRSLFIAILNCETASSINKIRALARILFQ